MPVSAKRLGFRFNRTEDSLSELNEDKETISDEIILPASALTNDHSDTQNYATSCTGNLSSGSDVNDTSTSNNLSESAQPQARNLKNLSIRDFFANRLNRTRSFEGGNPSPTIKEEASNWFEEFKAKVSKKSPSVTRTTNPNRLSQPYADEQYVILNDTLDNSPSKSVKDLKQSHDSGGTLTRDNCSAFQHDSSDNRTDNEESTTSDDDLEDSAQLNQCTYNSRSRKSNQKISYIGCQTPDFDTASINTVFNRRDSRYRRNRRDKSGHSSLSIRQFLLAMVQYMFPLNHDLLWKMIAMFNFVIALSALVASSKMMPLCSFINGLIMGIIATATCSLIVLASVLVGICPIRRTNQNNLTQCSFNSGDAQLTADNNLVDANRGARSQSESQDPQKISHVTIADPAQGSLKSVNLDDSDEYSGWMIEFMGQYEQRKNYADIKLQLIYVCLDGPLLRLCKPKRNADSNSTNFPAFVHQRCYDLGLSTNQSVTLLLPKNVRNQERWIWSKRYPIKIEFVEPLVGTEQQKSSPNEPVRLILFVRSCREKEEWFQRLKRSIEKCQSKTFKTIPSPILEETPPSPTRISLDSNASQYEEAVSNVDCSDAQFRCPTPLTQSKSEILSPKLISASGTSSPVHALQDKSRSDEPQSLTTDSIDDFEPGTLVRARSCDLSQLSTDVCNNSKTDNTSATTSLFDDHEEKRHSNPQGASSQRTGETKSKTQTKDTSAKPKPLQPTLDYKSFIQRVMESDSFASQNCAWFNSLIGRIFFDVLSHQYWSVKFKRKIQRKLHRIRLPYFMETLTLTKIDLGSKAPQFRNVVSHHFDSFGLSIDFDMAYSGGLELTFETKLNLLKIKEQVPGANSSSKGDIPLTTFSSVNTSSIPSLSTQPNATVGQQKEVNLATGESSMRSSVDLSDTDDTDSMLSSDSSSDDELDSDEISDWEDYGAERTRQNIVKFVDKIASSRYFQQATENKYIKKKLQDISNCPLVLIVQIQSLNGILTLNVPNPPTDRLWYGFRPNPELALRAIPRMGDREVNLSHVTEWIERKLVDEFRKVLVIPNMEDIVLRVLQSDADQSVYVVP